MSSPRVLKFGGVGLRDGEAVRRCARLVIERGGPRPVVVVSAHAGVTDLLLEAADHPHRWRTVWDHVRVRHRTLLRQLELDGELVDRHLRELRDLLERFTGQPRLDGRARDYVLSFGERMSARIVAAALRAAGRAAAPLDAFDLGLVGERRADHFLADAGAGERVRRSLDALLAAAAVPVVTGFLASDRDGNLTTLGRNGSDLSAAWIAAALEAEELQLWKTVPGVMTADPGLVPDARVLPELGLDEALALGAAGAAVLHPGAIAPARRAGVAVRLRDVRAPDASGTRLVEDGGELGPRALAHRAPLALLGRELDWNRDPGEQLVELLASLRADGVEPRAGAVRGDRLQVLIDERDGRVLEPHQPEREPAAHSQVERGLGTLSVVGPGVGVGGRWRAELEDVARSLGLALRPAPDDGCERSLTVLVAPHALPPLARALHARWFEAPRAVAARDGDPAGHR